MQLRKVCIKYKSKTQPNPRIHLTSFASLLSARLRIIP